MAMTPTQFVQKWKTTKFTSANYDRIDETYLQEFVDDIAAVFGVEAANVPEYDPAETYAKDYLVRFTPTGGQEAFYYSLRAGTLGTPGLNLVDWKVVPGPVKPTDLSQQLTLVQAQGIEGDKVVAGRTYLVDFGLDPGTGYPRTITLRGVSNNSFDTEGTLEVNGQRTPVMDVDVFSGTWNVKSDFYFSSQRVWDENSMFFGPDFTIERELTAAYVAANPLPYGMGRHSRLTIVEDVPTPFKVQLPNQGYQGDNGTIVQIRYTPPSGAAGAVQTVDFGTAKIKTEAGVVSKLTFEPGQWVHLARGPAARGATNDNFHVTLRGSEYAGSPGNLGGLDASLSFTYDPLPGSAATTTWDVTGKRHAATYVDLTANTKLALVNGTDGFVGTLLVHNTMQNPLTCTLPAGSFGPKNYQATFAAGERRMLTATYAAGTWYFNSAVYYPQ